MMLALSLEPKLSATFIRYLLQRNIRDQQVLVDRLGASSEMRLPRILLLLANSDNEDAPDMLVSELSQTPLAEMVGTTRSRASLFMNGFRKLGVIGYAKGGNLHIHSSRLLGLLDGHLSRYSP